MNSLTHQPSGEFAAVACHVRLCGLISRLSQSRSATSQLCWVIQGNDNLCSGL